MAHDAARGIRLGLSLDARELMSRAEREPEEIYNWSFLVRNNRLIICSDDAKSTRSTKLMITVNWPETSDLRVTGVAWVTNPKWNMISHPIPLSGEPKHAGGWIWRFSCPHSNKLVQTLHFDPENGLFVSREAIGRSQRRDNTARIVRHFTTLMELGNLAGGIDGFFSPAAKPKYMSQDMFEALEEAMTLQFIRMHLAVCGVPEPNFGDNGSITIPTPPKRRSR